MDKEKSKAFIELQNQLQILTDFNAVSVNNNANAENVGQSDNLGQTEILAQPPNSSLVRNRLLNVSQLVAARFLSNLSQAQFTSDLAIPSIYDHLPHLLQHPNGLTPSVKISRKGRRRVWLTIGIPTIKRTKVSYLTTTLRSLIDNLPVENREEVLIVVFIGELGVNEFVTEQIVTLHAEFADAMDSGLLEILVPSANYYPPDLDNLEPTFDDPPERMKWRAKQNLDYAYLMMYCQNRGNFYMQLEDDVITKTNYLLTIKGQFRFHRQC